MVVVNPAGSSGDTLFNFKIELRARPDSPAQMDWKSDRGKTSKMFVEMFYVSLFNPAGVTRDNISGMECRQLFTNT